MSNKNFLAESTRTVEMWEIENMMRRPNISAQDLTAVNKFAVVFLAKIYADVESFDETINYIEQNFEEHIKIRLLNTLEKFHDSIEKIGRIYKRKELNQALRDLKVLSHGVQALNKPQDIEKLVPDLLQIESGDTVLNLNAGENEFAVNIENKDVKIYGVDDSEDSEYIGKIRATVTDNLIVKRADVLNEDISLQADKIFCGLKVGLIRDRNFGNKKLQEFFEGMRCRICKEWVYLIAAVQYQKTGGRTVAILPENTPTNRADKEIRRKLIDSGRVEGVITLNDRFSLIILSEDNKFVKMFDATEIPADSIISQYNSDSENFIEVSSEEIASKNYVLYPQRYLVEKKIIIENARSLGEFVNIRRGTQLIRPDDLSRMKSDIPTNYQYLTIQDITEGGINENLTCIKPEYAKQYERYFINTGDIVISKFAPFKLAVVSQIDNKIFLSGNLYSMQVDSTKLNPYYLMLFLQSANGITQLNAMSSGGGVKIITPDNLGEIKIPIIPIEEQNKIAEQYLSLLSDLKKVRNNISTLIKNFIH